MSSAMESLFAAAREDAPEAAARDAMWNGIANATGVAASATVAAVATTAKPAAAGAIAASIAPKLIFIGAFIGVVSAAVGGVVALGWMESQTGVGADAAATAPVARAVRVPVRGAQLADPRPRARDPQQIDRADSPASAAPAATATASTNANASRTSTTMGSDLAEEARLVTEARAALVAGDSTRALALLKKTHRFPTRALEPEELSLEARALRAAGRIDDAAATELTLKARYPGHALAR